MFALCLCEKPPQAKALAVPPLQLATMVRATISDFNGICVMKYGSCFSCLRMRVCRLSLCSSLCGSDVCGCSEWVHRETEDALSCFS